MRTTSPASDGKRPVATLMSDVGPVSAAAAAKRQRTDDGEMAQQNRRDAQRVGGNVVPLRAGKTVPQTEPMPEARPVSDLTVDISSSSDDDEMGGGHADP